VLSLAAPITYIFNYFKLKKKTLYGKGITINIGKNITIITVITSMIFFSNGIFLYIFNIEVTILYRYHMVSDVKDKSSAAAITAIKINQDANIFVTELDKGKSAEFTVGNDRQVYLLCIEGQATVSFGDSCVSLDQHDASEVLKGGYLKVEATGSDSISAHMLMIEMAYQGPGRSDL
jgi:hypothetical protein